MCEECERLLCDVCLKSYNPECSALVMTIIQAVDSENKYLRRESRNFIVIICLL